MRAAERLSEENAVLGILVLDTRFPRIPGDVGNPASYDFPVRVRTVRGATVRRVVVEGDPELLSPFLQAARELEAEGVRAITTSCGFLAPFQETIARAVNVPVFLSSLVQIPLVYTLTQRRVGIITANSQALTRRHLAGAGVPESIPLAIGGLENRPAFSQAILEDGECLDRERVEQEVLEVAQTLVGEHPDIGAFVFECHNLAPYAPAVAAATGRPVFDIITLAEWVYRAVVKREF